MHCPGREDCSGILHAKEELRSVMDQIIQQSLAGKRFGLMGFDRREADSIIAALGTVRGIGHVIGARTDYSRAQLLFRLRCLLHQRFGRRHRRAAGPDRNDRAQPQAGGDHRLLRGSDDAASPPSPTSTANSFCGRARPRICCSGHTASSDSSRVRRKLRFNSRLERNPARSACR